MVTLIVFKAGQEEFRYPLKARLVNLGRSSQCDVVLADPSVSTLHANILTRKDGHQLVDLDSTNGTFLNGKKIEKEALKKGDVIGIGKYQITFDEAAAVERTGVTRVAAEERRFIEEGAASREREKYEKRLTALEAENTRLLRRAGKGLSVRFLGQSPAMQRLFSQAEKAAVTDLPLLITGETGTGKSAFARHIHSLSSRQNREFIVIDCASIPAALLESELFGHEKGAFTGAVAQKQGRIELAHQGTLFLDEIGDMPVALQAKLLRFLQEQAFERLGGNRTLHVDVRLIAATHRDLKGAIADKSFREDLFYRICGVQLQVPPLRERAEDALVMAEAFLQEVCAENNLPEKRFSAEAKNAILHHAWEGNVRELKHAVQSAAVLCSAAEIGLADLGLAPGRDFSDFTNLTLEQARAEMERKLITWHLLASNGNYSKTAKALDIDRGRLARLMEKYGLEGKKANAGEEADEEA